MLSMSLGLSKFKIDASWIEEIKASIPGNESDDEYDEIITDDEINIFD